MTNDWLCEERGGLSRRFERRGGVVYIRYGTTAGSGRDSVEALALKCATGQTLGYLPDERSLEDYVAKVVAIDAERDESGYHGFWIGYPGHLFGSDMAGLMTVVFGKISFSPGLRLLAVDPDEAYLASVQGPRFGFEHLRNVTGVPQGPLLMAILKPGIGPDPAALARQFEELQGGGVAIVKDDEVCIDTSTDKALRRLSAVQRVASGKTLYVMNLTAPAHRLIEHARTLQSAGAQAFLFNVYTYGLSALQSLAEDPALRIPVFVHPALSGALRNQGPDTCGIDAGVLLGSLPRLAGGDGVLFPSPYGSVALPPSEAMRVHEALSRPWGHLKPAASVPSTGITVNEVPMIRRDFGDQVIINAGTGLVRGDLGVAEGARAFLAAMTLVS